MSNSAKVLNGFMERRALEAAFQELAETESIDQLVERARDIAGHGNGAIPVLISLLDTTDPQVRGGLGQVAAQLERDQVVPALRGVARSRDRSDHARLTAMMILDRYLHEPVDESLLAGLQDPDAVAVQSLRELSHEMQRNSFVVIEYLNQLSEQPAEVAEVVLDAMPRLEPDANLVTLLRMVAQGPNAALAQKAIEQLSRTRIPEAASALASLTATLPPDLTALADRGLRKLHMMGLADPERPSSEGWRALLSPVDGSGAQVVWFVGPGEDTDRGTIFSILCKDPEGIVASFGTSEVPAADLPPANSLGGEYVIRQGEDGPPIQLLEVPLDDGRWVIRRALDLLWDQGHVPPIEYRLLNPMIWDLGPLPASDEPDEGTDEAQASVSQSATLLDHSAFASWFWQAAPVYEAAERLGRRPSLAERSATIDELLERNFDRPLLAGYHRRLDGMAHWLRLADQAGVAHLASLTAANIESLPAVRNPFLRRLVGQGLDVAVANLRSGFDLRQRSGMPA